MKLFVYIAVLLMLTACGGGGAHVRSEVTTVSKGQQLFDLKKAYEDGAINQDEYNKEKAKVLGNN